MRGTTDISCKSTPIPILSVYLFILILAVQYYYKPSGCCHHRCFVYFCRTVYKLMTLKNKHHHHHFEASFLYKKLGMTRTEMPPEYPVHTQILLVPNHASFLHTVTALFTQNEEFIPSGLQSFSVFMN